MISYRIDWLQFSVSEVNLTPFVGMDLDFSESGGPFHKKSLKGRGITVYFDPKPDVKNWPMEVKITGEALSTNYSVCGAVYDTFLSLGLEVRVARIDFCVDVMSKFGSFEAFDPKREDFVIKEFFKRAHFSSFHDQYGEWTGLKMGKHECVFRVYDKLKERGQASFNFVTWWRMEVALRGEQCRAYLDVKKYSFNELCSMSPCVIRDEFARRFEIPEWYAAIFEGNESEVIKQRSLKPDPISSAKVKYHRDRIISSIRKLREVGGVDVTEKSWNDVKIVFQRILEEESYEVSGCVSHWRERDQTGQER